MSVTPELCPQCDNMVELDARLEVQHCPHCQWPMAPCSWCRENTHNVCYECPLE